MPAIRCHEQHEVSGESAEAVLAAMRDHLREAHSGLVLPDGAVEDYVEAALRMGAPRSRLVQISRPTVVPLTPALAETWLRFFDCEGFTDNPSWAGCYCMYYRVEQWQQRRAADNRRDAAALIAAGGQRGFLAFVDGEPAGWLNAGPRAGYTGMPEVAGGDGHDAAATCFVIAPPYRRHGIARLLLDAAISHLGAEGFTRLLAFPVAGADSAATMYHGPLPMYDAAGFERLGEDGRRIIMAKALA